MFDAHFVDLFVVDGGSIVESGVTTVRVVPRFDELEDRHTGGRWVREADPIEQLALQGREKGLAHRVVVTVPHRVHGGTNAGRLTALPKGDRGVLAAPATLSRR